MLLYARGTAGSRVTNGPDELGWPSAHESTMYTSERGGREGLHVNLCRPPAR